MSEKKSTGAGKGQVPRKGYNFKRWYENFNRIKWNRAKMKKKNKYE